MEMGVGQLEAASTRNEGLRFRQCLAVELARAEAD
jgi:hypothetical protein